LFASGAIIYAYVNGNPVKYTDPRGLNPFAGAAAGGELGAIGGPYGVVVGAILGGIAGEVAVEAIIDAIVDPYRNEIPIKDLDPLHPPETIGNRPDLGGLTDEELLDSVRNPADGNKLTINTKTGKLVDGNSRARELTRRSKDPNSCITPDTTVPVDPYTPNDSMFLD